LILIDTSALIDALCGPRRSLDQLKAFGEAGERLALPAVVLYEWLRGPRLPQELRVQEELFPRDQAIPFDSEGAALAAELYRSLGRARGREIDLTIAATTILRDASLWTLNRADFKDIRGLRLA
jgi:predicted nucleic acid-binding protein